MPMGAFPGYYGIIIAMMVRERISSGLENMNLNKQGRRFLPMGTSDLLFTVFFFVFVFQIKHLRSRVNPGQNPLSNTFIHTSFLNLVCGCTCGCH